MTDSELRRDRKSPPGAGGGPGSGIFGLYGRCVRHLGVCPSGTGSVAIPHASSHFFRGNASGNLPELGDPVLRWLFVFPLAFTATPPSIHLPSFRVVSEARGEEKLPATQACVFGCP